MCPAHVNKALHDLVAIFSQPCFRKPVPGHHSAAVLLGLQYLSMSITVLLLSDGPTKGYIWDMYVHSQNR